jgi:hypothetical protein
VAAATVLAVTLGLVGSAMANDSVSPKQSTSARPTVGAARTPGVPAGGPDALYAPPPTLAMTSNHDPRFRAPYNLVSGTERYVGGEYQYTGYAYDDEDSAYPDDFGRYANNSANLIEFRIAPYAGGTLYRFTFNALVQKDSTIATVAFNTDRKSTGSSTLPKDPGLPFPGTDRVLTTWGTGAQWSTWTRSGWKSVGLHVTTDLTANQVTIEVPDRVARPAGEWSATLATGLYDRATKGWLPIAASSNNRANIVNLGFRFNEIRQITQGIGSTNPADYLSVVNANSPWSHQSAALQAGAPTRFARTLHFDWLRTRKSWDNIPRHGIFLRMAPSFLKGATSNLTGEPTGISAVDGLGQTTPDRVFRTEGKDTVHFGAQYYSPLQPYAIYVPTHYVPGERTKLMFWLHPDEGEYYGLGTGSDLPIVFGENRNSIIIDPVARSNTGFFAHGELEEALFEAWNDVARHYTLDPTRTVMAGGSGGGYGAYRTGAMWPGLFASVVSVVPGGQVGIYVPGLSDRNTVLNDWLPNLRNLPVMHISDMLSELTFYPGNVQNAIGPPQLGNSLEQLKYRYVFRSVAKDHFLIGFDGPYVANWMGDRKVEDRPFHVTYVREPATDSPEAGIVHNSSFWLSHIELRDSSKPVAKGLIDAISSGFGIAQPDTALETPVVGMDSPGNFFAQVERSWGPWKPAPRKDRIVINATNIRTVTIDPRAARVSCDVKVEIHSDGPLAVRLLGCPR